MQRKLSSAQQGQGWLVSFAVIILLAAVGAVLYTISQTTLIKPQQPAKELPVATFSDKSLDAIVEQLAANYLASNDSGRKEDIQALTNTLSNLKSSQHDTAKLALQQLGDDQLPDAINTLKDLALSTQNKRNAAKLWVDIGNIENLKSDETAVSAYQKSVTLDPDNINAWNRIGHLERQRGDYDKAEIAYKNVTRLSNTESRTEAVSLANFGLLYQSQKKFDEAIQSFELALSINTELKNEGGIASNSENLASLYRNQGSFEEAERYYQAALSTYENAKQYAKQIEIHSALGSLYQTKQQTELALAEYEKALELNKAQPNQRFSAGLYSNMGILAQQKNELEKAEEYFDQSLALFQAAENPRGTADQYSNLAILARSKKQFEASETLHLKAIALYEAVENKSALTSQYTNLGFLYTAWNKKDTACEYWQKSLTGLTEKQQSRKDRIQAIVDRDCLADKKEAPASAAKQEGTPNAIPKKPMPPSSENPKTKESSPAPKKPAKETENPASSEAGNDAAS
ncbi:MAG: DUF2225 domain-containing protein [Leucothrix sp.]